MRSYTHILMGSLVPKELACAEFKEQYKGFVFVKLTNLNEIHNDVMIKTGVNIDPNPWFPHYTCFPGKIYFIDIDDMLNWVCYNGETPMVYFRIVTLVNDSKIYVENSVMGEKYGTDKMILSEPYNIRDYFNNKLLHLIPGIDDDTITYLYEQASKNKIIQYYLGEQLHPKTTKEYIYTINKTLDISIKCFEENIITFDKLSDIHKKEYINMLMREYKDISKLIIYVNNPTIEMLLYYAQDVKYYDIKYCIYHTYELLELLKKSNNILLITEYFFEEMYDIWKKNNARQEYIIIMCKLVYLLVEKQNISLKYIPFEFVDIEKNTELIKNDWKMIGYINNPTKLQCYYAIAQSYKAIELIEHPRNEFLEFAISQNWQAILLIKPQKRTFDLWTIAILQNDDAIDAFIQL